MTGKQIARLKVTLNGIRPPIWRRLEVPLEFTFRELSDVILAAFGWTNTHLHQFEVGKRLQPGQRSIGMPDVLDEDEGDFLPPTDAELARLFPGLPKEEARLFFPPPLEDETRVTLADVLTSGQRLLYLYDFGDDWRYAVLVEAILSAEKETVYPRVTAGRRAAPPEDSGGVWGYEHLLTVLAEPTQEEDAELLDWLRDQYPYFAPEEFDLAAADEAGARPAFLLGVAWAACSRCRRGCCTCRRVSIVPAA